MTIPRARVRDGERAGEAASRFTAVGVRSGALPEEWDAEAEEDELMLAILLGAQFAGARRPVLAAGVGLRGKPSRGVFPRLMCSSTAASVRPGALHQRRRPAEFLRAGGDSFDGPSWRASSCWCRSSKKFAQ